MLYLTTPPTEQRLAYYQAHQIGVMVTPAMGNRPNTKWPYFACDNGCFAETPDRPFHLDGFLAWLDRLPRVGCLFAVAPDVVGDWTATIDRSLPVLPAIRSLGFPAALVLQNGVTSPTDVPWNDVDAVFVGGDDAFKYSAVVARLVGEATRRGKWAHVGRVNSLNRMKWCRTIGADSADGTYVAFGPDINLPKLAGWLADVRAAPPLSLGW